MFDSGILCPEFSSFGFFPFPISRDYQELLNYSGFSGPIPKLNSTRGGTSGIIGDGTFYPGSGNLDAMSRLYWCVKDYTLNIQIFRQVNNCLIGEQSEDGHSVGTPDQSFQTLTTQDYCSFNAPTGTFGKDPISFCPTELYGLNNPNTNTCVPINPIQKFNDLLCRQSYFSWSPQQSDWNNFNNPNINLATGINSPYLIEFQQSDISSDITLEQSVFGLINFSLMDINSLGVSGNFPQTLGITGYYPSLIDSLPPFSCLGKSGEALTNNWGEITGYGVNIKPSGIFTPYLFDQYNLISGYPATGNIQSFCPFVYFYLRLFNQVSATESCPVNDKISSLMTLPNQIPIGALNIYDFIANNTPTGQAATRILTLPLFSEETNNPSQINVVVNLNPSNEWINSKRENLY